MDPVEISPLEFATVARMCAEHELVLSQASSTTIAITRDSMVARFPEVQNELYYDAMVLLLRETTPYVYWMPSGKTDDVGFFDAYAAPGRVPVEPPLPPAPKPAAPVAEAPKPEKPKREYTVTLKIHSSLGPPQLLDVIAARLPAKIIGGRMDVYLEPVPETPAA